MRDMISTTPLAEYVDMIYNRLAIEMPRHNHIKSWWVELRPPGLEDRPEEGVGFVNLRARIEDRIVTYRADMYAIQHGAMISAEVLERVVAHHLAKFVEATTS